MQKQLKILKINGFKCFFQEPYSVLELTNYMGFNKNVIVVDYNGYILEVTSWAKTSLKHNDCLEILSMAGGG